MLSAQPSPVHIGLGGGGGHCIRSPGQPHRGGLTFSWERVSQDVPQRPFGGQSGTRTQASLPRWNPALPSAAGTQGTCEPAAPERPCSLRGLPRQAGRHILCPPLSPCPTCPLPRVSLWAFFRQRQGPPCGRERLLFTRNIEGSSLLCPRRTLRANTFSSLNLSLLI